MWWLQSRWWIRARITQSAAQTPHKDHLIDYILNNNEDQKKIQDNICGKSIPLLWLWMLLPIGISNDPDMQQGCGSMGEGS